MGFYLNGNKPASLFSKESKRPYFVDKTAMPSELIPLAENGAEHICLARPPHFGKTAMAAIHARLPIALVP